MEKFLARMSEGLRALWAAVEEAEKPHASLFAEFAKAQEAEELVPQLSQEAGELHRVWWQLAQEYLKVEPLPLEMSKEQAREFLALCGRRGSHTGEVYCQYQYECNRYPEVRRQVRFFIQACNVLDIPYYYYAGGWEYRAL